MNLSRPMEDLGINSILVSFDAPQNYEWKGDPLVFTLTSLTSSTLGQSGDGLDGHLCVLGLTVVLSQSMDEFPIQVPTKLNIT